jgi:hypothetical protein
MTDIPGEFCPGAAFVRTRRLAFAGIAGLITVTASGCSDCWESRNEYAYSNGDRCLLVLPEGGRISISPAPIVIAPFTPSAEPSADDTEPAEGTDDGPYVVAAVTGYRDANARVAADNHVVIVSLSNDCEHPPGLGSDLGATGGLAGTFGLPHSITEYARIEVASDGDDADGHCVDIASGVSLRCFLAPVGVAEFRIVSGSIETPPDQTLCLWAESGGVTPKAARVVVTAGIAADATLIVVADGDDCASDGDCTVEAPNPGAAACTSNGASCGVLSLPVRAELVRADGSGDSVDFSLQGNLTAATVEPSLVQFGTRSDCGMPRPSAPLVLPQGTSRTNSVTACIAPREQEFDLVATLVGVEGLETLPRTIVVPQIPRALRFEPLDRVLGEDGSSTYKYLLRGEDCDGGSFSPADLAVTLGGSAAAGTVLSEVADGWLASVTVAPSTNVELSVSVPAWESECFYTIP